MKGIIQEFLESIVKDIYDVIYAEVNKYKEEFIEKSSRKIFNIGVVVSIIFIGLLLFFWGIASYVDMLFKMNGLGFILMGTIVSLIGMLSYEKFCK